MKQDTFNINIDKGLINTLFFLGIVGLAYLTITWNNTLVIAVGITSYWFGLLVGKKVLKENK